MLCRRRTLCLLEAVYEAFRGRELDDVLRLSGKLRAELLSLVIIAPLMQANLRAAPTDRLWLVDASSRKLAVVSTAINPKLAKELGRFSLRKGVWNRMLPPSMQWARSHGILAEDDELPRVGGDRANDARHGLDDARLGDVLDEDERRAVRGDVPQRAVEDR